MVEELDPADLFSKAVATRARPPSWAFRSKREQPWNSLGLGRPRDYLKPLHSFHNRKYGRYSTPTPIYSQRPLP